MTFLDIELNSSHSTSFWLARALRLWSSLKAFFRRRRQQRIDRQAFENLLFLDRRVLDDLGYRHDDVQTAYRLPLSVNAAQHLRLQRKVERESAGKQG